MKTSLNIINKIYFLHNEKSFRLQSSFDVIIEKDEDKENFQADIIRFQFLKHRIIFTLNHQVPL